MKKFKKVFLILIIVICAVLTTGCKDENVEGTLEEIMTKVYSGIKEEDRPMMLANTTVDSENIEYYLGTSDIEYEEALASEPQISSIAHSVVLVRVKDNADIEGIKTKIKDNINPNKWVCVGVEEDDVTVLNKGNLIVLILVEDANTREALIDGFNNL